MILQENGYLRYQSNGVDIGEWGMAIEIDNELLHLRDAEISSCEKPDLAFVCVFPGKNITWKITVKSDEYNVIVDSTILNTGERPVSLGKVYLLSADQSVRMGSLLDDIVVLPWRILEAIRVYRLLDKDLPKLGKVKVQFYNRTQNRTLQVGFLTFQRANTEITFDGDAEHGLHTLNAYCDFAGWKLECYSETNTETFRLRVGNDPLEQLEDWAETVADIYHPEIWSEAPIGFAGGSWVDSINGHENYEDVALKTLDAVNDRLKGFGVHYLWTSIKNLEGGMPGNWLGWNLQNIPCGREEFFRKVYEKGFLPGLWVGPFYICSALKEKMLEFKEAILKNPDGSLMVVCDEWAHGDSGKLPKKDRPRLYALDPSHPKSLDIIRQVFETYRQWGVRYYMVDFLVAGAGNIQYFPYKDHFDTSLVKGPEVFTNFMKTVKKAAGSDTYLVASTGPNIHNTGFIDGVRVGNDLGEGRLLNPESFFYPATYVINTLDFWTGAKFALLNQAANFHTHRKLYLNDSGNVLTVDKPIPLAHAQIVATIHAFSGGPTMLGDDIRSIGEDRLALIKKTLPRSKDVGIPVDLFDSPYPVGPRLFHRRIEKRWGRFDILAVYNLEDRPMEMVVDFSKLRLDVEKEYLAWDFWNEALIGKIRRSMTILVPPETVKVIRLTENTNHAEIVGTDMHVMMGEMEIAKISYDATTMTCRITANRPAGERGMVFVYAPDDVYVKNFDGLHIAKDGRDNSLVIGVPMLFDQTGSACREIQFGKLKEILDMSKLNLA
jgi:urease beta subunit